MTVAEQTLDGMDIHTGFQQVSCKGVTQRVDAALTTQPGPVSCHTIYALCHLNIYRPTAGRVGEQP